MQVAQTNGGENPYSWRIMGEVVQEAALAALEQGDMEQFDTYLSLIDSAHYGDNDALANICMAGITQDHARSRTVLENHLSEELRETAAKEYNYAFPDFLINSVLRKCARDKSAPDIWIDNYSASTEHRWSLQMFFQQERLWHEPDNSAYQRDFDIVAGQLAWAPLDRLFVETRMAEAVANAQDSSIRGNLAIFYFTDICTRPGSAHRIGICMDVARSVLGDPNLATPALADYLENQLNALLPAQTEQTLSGEYLDWKLDVHAYRGATPEQLLQVMDEYLMAVANASDQKDVASPLAQQPDRAEPDELVDFRDSTLHERAVDFAKKGDLAAASLYVSHIADSETQELTCEECLKYATSAEDVSSFAQKQDALTTDFNPTLALHIKVAEALHSDDAVVVNLAHELANKAVQNAYDPYGHILIDAYEQLAQIRPDAALALAKSVLPILRQGALTYYDIHELSMGLIAAGDIAEAESAVQQIVDEVGGEKSLDVHSLWQIAKALQQPYYT